MRNIKMDNEKVEQISRTVILVNQLVFILFLIIQFIFLGDYELADHIPGFINYLYAFFIINVIFCSVYAKILGRSSFLWGILGFFPIIFPLTILLLKPADENSKRNTKYILLGHVLLILSPVFFDLSDGEFGLYLWWAITNIPLGLLVLIINIKKEFNKDLFRKIVNRVGSKKVNETCSPHKFCKNCKFSLKNQEGKNLFCSVKNIRVTPDYKCGKWEAKI